MKKFSVILVIKENKVEPKSLSEISISKHLQPFHLDLFEPTQIRSLGGKHYML